MPRPAVRLRLTTPATPRDGRAARTARTRTAIAEAVLALLESGRLEPTTVEIAARAGIAERTLFHHFADLEALYTEVSDRQFARLLADFPLLDARGTLTARIDTLVDQRTRLHELVTPVRRAALRLEPRSPAIAGRLARARHALRRDAARVFAREINATPQARRAELRDALAVASSWSVWEQLRRHAGLSVPRARAVVRRLLEAILEVPRNA